MIEKNIKKPMHCLRCDVDMIKKVTQNSLNIQGYNYSSQSECYECPKCKQRTLDESQFDALYQRLKELSVKNWQAEQFEFNF